MSEQKIGAQLDELGLTADVEDGYRIREASVELTIEPADEDADGGIRTVSARYPEPEAAHPVPSPVERRIITVIGDGREITDEQRKRVTRWLTANEIDPTRVSAGHQITVECNVRGQREARRVIGFTEFYVDKDGHKVSNPRNLREVLTYERWVDQVVPLEADPAWPGWDVYERRVAEHKAADSE